MTNYIFKTSTITKFDLNSSKDIILFEKEFDNIFEAANYATKELNGLCYINSDNTEAVMRMKIYNINETPIVHNLVIQDKEFYGEY
jgi:hypothetical protein